MNMPHARLHGSTAFATTAPRETPLPVSTSEATWTARPLRKRLPTCPECLNQIYNGLRPGSQPNLRCPRAPLSEDTQTQAANQRKGDLAEKRNSER